MKTSKELFTRTFTVDNKQQEKYEHWVDETAKLLYGTKINKFGKVVCKDPRGYWKVHKMVEDWPIEKIKERYLDATKVEGMPKDVWWFWKRKQEKSGDK